MGDDVGVGEGFHADLCCHCDLIVVQILQVVWCLLLDNFSRIFIDSLRKDCIGCTCPPDASTLKVADGLLLRRHKCVIICRVLAPLRIWNELDVSFLSASDMRDCIFCQFYPGLPVLLYDVASDVGIALSTLDDYAVIAASIDRILPYFSCTQLRTIRSCDFDAILMTSIDFIFD